MDPYNLAICFGPTLVPVPDHKDQVQYQNLVNELIKNFIILLTAWRGEGGGGKFRLGPPSFKKRDYIPAHGREYLNKDCL